MNRLQILTTVVALLFVVNLSAQNFNFKSDIDSVNSSGHYKIQLAPEVLSKLNCDVSDIRIIDDKGNQSAYILEKEQPINKSRLFKEYKIVRNKHRRFWGHTRLIIHNPKKDDIDNIALLIRNNDVHKWLKLSGSDNKEDWYAIKNEYYYHSMYNDDETSVIQVLDFPKSNYEYYELRIRDYYNDPIQVLKAGYFDVSIERGKYSEHSKPTVTQNDTAKEKFSRVTIKFNEAKYIDKINFEIDDPEYYYRRAKLKLISRVETENAELQIIEKTVKEFIISSNSLNSIYLNNYKGEEFVLEISNKDDKPISVVGATASQLNYYLISKLDAKSNYTLKFGNDTIDAPVYDINYFKDTISKDIKNVSHANVVKVDHAKEAAIDEDKPFYLDKRILWSVIGLVILLLGYMSFKMLKEVKEK